MKEKQENQCKTEESAEACAEDLSQNIKSTTGVESHEAAIVCVELHNENTDSVASGKVVETITTSINDNNGIVQNMTPERHFVKELANNSLVKPNDEVNDDEVNAKPKMIDVYVDEKNEEARKVKDEPEDAMVSTATHEIEKEGYNKTSDDTIDFEATKTEVTDKPLEDIDASPDDLFDKIAAGKDFIKEKVTQEPACSIPEITEISDNSVVVPENVTVEANTSLSDLQNDTVDDQLVRNVSFATGVKEPKLTARLTKNKKKGNAKNKVFVKDNHTVSHIVPDEAISAEGDLAKRKSTSSSSEKNFDVSVQKSAVQNPKIKQSAFDSQGNRKTIKRPKKKAKNEVGLSETDALHVKPLESEQLTQVTNATSKAKLSIANNDTEDKKENSISSSSSNADTKYDRTSSGDVAVRNTSSGEPLTISNSKINDKESSIVGSNFKASELEESQGAPITKGDEAHPEAEKKFEELQIVSNQEKEKDMKAEGLTESSLEVKEENVENVLEKPSPSNMANERNGNVEERPSVRMTEANEEYKVDHDLANSKKADIKQFQTCVRTDEEISHNTNDGNKWSSHGRLFERKENTKTYDQYETHKLECSVRLLVRLDLDLMIYN